MPYNLEIEFKNLLSQENFYSLCTLFKIQSDDFVLQKNFYYDYDDILSEKLMSLRIRIRNNERVITLKQKAVQSQHAQIEITEPLTSSIEEFCANPSELLPKAIRNHLSMEQISLDKLEAIGRVDTLRKELNYQGGLLCLDYNRFNNLDEDYELEFEFNSINDGETLFDNFLVQNNIPLRPAKSKIIRMIEYRNRRNETE
jgi:Uncharacterized protein conserved in bacteria